MPQLVALAPLVGDHVPSRVREGDVLRASEYVAQRLVMRGLAVPCEVLMRVDATDASRDQWLETEFVRAAQAIAAMHVRKRGLRK